MQRSRLRLAMHNILLAFLLSAKSVRSAYYNRLPGHSCKEFQDKNLGSSFGDAQECGAAARLDPECTGSEIMWSPSNPKWGCRCCGPKPKGKSDEEAYKVNKNWNIWDYFELSIPPPMIKKPSSCPSEMVELVIHIKTDSFPFETTWKVTKDCEGNATELQGGKYDQPHHEYEHRHCVPPARYTFTVSDWFGDGICCDYHSGTYSVEYNGDVVANGAGDFQYSESTTFSQCEETVLSLPGTSCVRFQEKKLGTHFETPQECGHAARLDPACMGTEIMWPKYKAWGCRCCGPHPDIKEEMYKENKNWNIYQFRSDPFY